MLKAAGSEPTSPVPVDDKQLFYNRFAGDFDHKMNRYDLEKRIDVIFDVLLKEDLTGKQVLDGGCGTGWFSARAVQRGAHVTSLDVGYNLLCQTALKCKSNLCNGSLCDLPFREGVFDIVFSSEVIEHVPDPERAFEELVRVLKPGGVLALTTPNRIWHWAIRLANALGARPYEGHENWAGYGELRTWAQNQNLIILDQFGFHLFPFVFSFTNSLLNFIDRAGKVLGPVMLNQAILARKPTE